MIRANMRNIQYQKSEQIYHLLRKSIIRHQMAPGQIISEKDLCAELNVSRTPVREALRRLADEDLVKVYPHSGTYVSEISYDIAKEGYAIRRALEGVGVRSASTLITNEQIDNLWALVTEMRRILREGLLDQYIEVDDAFHRSIAEYSGFAHLWKFINLAKVHLDRLRQISAPVPGHLLEATNQHEAILKALAKGNTDQADLAMQVHLDDAYQVEQAYFDHLKRPPSHNPQ